MRPERQASMFWPLHRILLTVEVCIIAAAFAVT